MSIEWFIYLAGVAESVNFLSYFIGAFSCVCGPALYCASFTDDNLKMRQTGKSMFIIGITLAIVFAFVPSGRTIYMIAGVHYGKEAMQTETAQKVAKLLNDKLDAEIAKLGESK